MIVCICRNISDKNFKSKEELLKRLKEDDIQCATCVKFLEQTNERQIRKNIYGCC